MFGLFRTKKCPEIYTEEHLKIDCTPKRINAIDAYESGYPLVCAMERAKEPSIIKSLINYGADVKVPVKLLRFHFNNNPTVTKMFIDAGLDIDGCYYSETLLHMFSGIWSGYNTKVLKFLLDAGADVNKSCEFRYFDPPIIEAAQGNNYAAIKLLIQYGAKVNNINFVTPPLYLAVLGNSSGVASAFGKEAMNPNIECVKLLINAGADVNWSNDSESILDIAYVSGNRDIIKLLIDSGANKTLN